MAPLAPSARVKRTWRSARRLTAERDRPRQSTLLVPVPAAEAPVAAWRGRPGPVGAPGLPLHVTLLHPFVAPRAIDAAVEAALHEVVADMAQFRFVLARLARFPGVLYLAPEPPEPFVELTGALQERWPEHPPYGGAYESVIPHLTVALGGEAYAGTRGLERALPIEACAREVWLMTESWSGRWSTRMRLGLRAP